MSPSPNHRIPIGELRTALAGCFATGPGDSPRFAGVRRRQSAYSTSHQIDNLDVRLSDGSRRRLVVKDLSPGSLLPAARRVRPGFLYDPRREIRTYTAVLDGRGWGTPRYYGAIESAESGRYWLFLERIEGVPLWQVGAMESWDAAARWIGRLHATIGIGRGFQATGGMAHLPRMNAAHFDTWVARADNFVRRRFGKSSSDAWRRFGRIVANYPAVVRRLARLPATLVHGEFYPSNVIRRTDGSICPVDWELASIGPGLLDVAALVSGEWSESERARMVGAYRAALAEGGVAAGSIDTMARAIECCQLHLAMQWLGWAEDWEPPSEHAKDWLREALRLGKRLGII